MKKIINFKKYLFLAVFANIVLASCLKDKGFDEGRYGAINSNTEGAEWISIPYSSRPNNAVFFGVEAKPGNQTIGLFPISYDYKDPASTDIAVTMQLNNALVTNYNTTQAAADPNFTPVTLLPANAYSIPSLNITIPAGRRVSDPFPIVINTDLLDPTKKYAVGFSIASVSKSGVGIAENLKNVVFILTIKNKYDGIYVLRSRMDIPSDRAATWVKTPFTYPYFIHLITTGPKSVEWLNEAFGTEGYHPLMTPGVSGFGATRPAFLFDNNDKIISITNAFPNPSNGRQFNMLTGVDPITGVTINNHYDPATKTVYAAFQMTQPGFAPMPIFDTLKFEKARP